MSVASVETTLELSASSLRDVKARMRGLFKQERMAVSAGLFLDRLLGEERRTIGWMRAEAAGDPGPGRQQSVLGRGHWNAGALPDIGRAYAVETLGAADAVWDGNTWGPQARSPTAKWACSRPMSRATATPSSIAR